MDDAALPETGLDDCRRGCRRRFQIMHHHSAFQRLGQYELADKQFLLALALRRSLAFVIEIQTDFPDPCLRMAAQQRSSSAKSCSGVSSANHGWMPKAIRMFQTASMTNPQRRANPDGRSQERETAIRRTPAPRV